MPYLLGGTYWVCRFDDNQELFYHNTRTLETSYELPWAMKVLCDKPAVETDGWGEFFDERSGLFYWYNVETGENRWLRPVSSSVNKSASNVTPVSHTESELKGKGADWKEYELSDGSGVYYYNEATGESQHEKPDGLDEN